nr:MAG TPA: hypothetical protein [Caudoviricetes sp.]
MQIAWQKHCYYSKTPLLLHYKSNGVCTKFVSIVELVALFTYISMEITNPQKCDK